MSRQAIAGVSIGLVVGLVLAVASVPMVHAQSGSITATLTDDTYINHWSTHSNYGNEPTLRVSMDYNITWLKFDLSNVPIGAEGITALLELYTAWNGVPNPHSVVACLIQNNFNNTWDESTITAHNNPPEIPYIELDSEYVANNEVWYEWNVTEAVVSAIDNNSSALTLILTYPSGASAPEILFNSKEGSLTKIPKLTVSWSIIPDIPSSMLTVLVIISLSTGALVFRKKVLKNQN